MRARQLINSAVDLINKNGQNHGQNNAHAQNWDQARKSYNSETQNSQKPKISAEKRKRLEALDQQILGIMQRGKLLQEKLSNTQKLQTIQNVKKFEKPLNLTPAKTVHKTVFEQNIANLVQEQVGHYPMNLTVGDDTLEQNQILAGLLDMGNVDDIDNVERVKFESRIPTLNYPSEQFQPDSMKVASKSSKNQQNHQNRHPQNHQNPSKPFKNPKNPYFIRLNRITIELSPGILPPKAQQSTTVLFLTCTAQNNQILKTSVRVHTEKQCQFEFSKNIYVTDPNSELNFTLSMRTYRDRQAKPVGRGCLVVSEIQADTAASCEILKFSTKVLKNRRNVQKSVGIGSLNLESVSAETEDEILRKLKGRDRDFVNTGKQQGVSQNYQMLQNEQNKENGQNQSPSQESSPEHQNNTPPPLLLYTAFICPQARNLPNIPISDQNIRTFTAPSTFLVIRSAIFSGTDKTFVTETVHTQISPKYNCKLMWPMKIEPALVGLFRNNLVIVEVWNKAVTGNKLLGLVKISTHQWFLSLEDEAVAKHAVSCTVRL